MFSKAKIFVVALLCLGLASKAGAALFDRGGGLIYDDVLNVTWLQDANYANTTGYAFHGRMPWQQAMTWADTLVYHDSVRNVDYSDWRLPTARPLNGVSFNFDFSFFGDTDWSYNLKSPVSELSYMYYVNLGLKGMYDPEFGWMDTGFGVLGAGFTTDGDAQADVGLFKNVQNDTYATNLRFGTHVVMMNAYMGVQVLQNLLDGNNFKAWAVRDGDVAAIPEPGGLALLFLGLVGILGIRRQIASGTC